MYHSFLTQIVIHSLLADEVNKKNVMYMLFVGVC